MALEELMRAFRFLNLAILSVLVGSAALVNAQDEKQQEEKPARQEEAKPQPRQEEAKPPRQDEAKPSSQDRQVEKQDQKRGQEQSREQAKPEGQEHPQMQGEHAQPTQEHPEIQGDRNRRGQEHPEVQNGRGQRSGKGGRIPDDRFRAQFGREHHFNARTVIVSGRPQFQYGGYNFELIDAWPADWAYTDDCYIDYIDGDYYLIDLVHPGVRLAVFVVM
jgi:flagellar motor protein MotB